MSAAVGSSESYSLVVCLCVKVAAMAKWMILAATIAAVVAAIAHRRLPFAYAVAAAALACVWQSGHKRPNTATDSYCPLVGYCYSCCYCCCFYGEPTAERQQQY